MRMTGARMACLAAAAAASVSLVPPPGLAHPGFALFIAWAALCVAAVLAGRLLLWAFLGAAPLTLVSVDWLAGPRFDPSGFHPWGEITLFAGIALVIAATGVLSIVRTAIRSA